MDSMFGASHREATSGPGNDTRQWISNGVVNAAASNAPTVDFTGKAGPLVSVRLHPCDIDVRCRVASWLAGGGQGEWHPFVGGDEVVVALPQGSERGGAIIIGRLNNGVDPFPTNVANNDVTQNNVTTRKSIPSYCWEISNGWLLRSITTTAQLALDVTGQWTISSGDLHFLQLGSKGPILSLAQMASYIQIDPATGQVILLATGPSSARLVLDPATGNITAATSGGFPVGHAATAEGAANLVLAVLTPLLLAMASAVASVPVAGTALAAALTLMTTTPGALATIVNAAVGAAAAGGVPTNPYALIANAVQSALSAQRDPTGQVEPGLGAIGLLV